jgi:peptidyl-prolyl cis-trans isomerase SurA
MRTFLCCVAAVLFALYATGPQVFAKEELVDGVAAVVNGDVITLSQVREVAAARERVLRDTYRGAELVEKIKEARLAALKDMIDRQLILQEFKKEGLTLPDRVVDQQIQTIIREEFGGDRNAFIRTLEAQGYTMAKFREIERDKFIVQIMRSRNVKLNRVISPQKVEEYYKAHRAEYTTPEQIKLRMIVLSHTNLETNEDQKALAEEIRAKLVGGADFDRMAQLYSEDSTRVSGGVWGWIERNTLTEELSKVAFGLKAGSISPVVSFNNSYYIMMVEARKNATTRPLSELRHEIEKQLLQEARQEALQRWLDSLRAKAYIKTF